MSKFLLGSIVLLGVALTVAAVSQSRGNIRTHASHREAGRQRSAAGPARTAARYDAPDHFLSGRAELPQ
jgi:hypothetical protein